MSRSLVLGTAGHIDHGKTALVRALTGIDTDRLAEEKRRGITIDLGFAELRLSDDLACGVVDVPGHEGFIRNMVAGATGIDLVLLVIAADEGVMPQTREHLAIVELLGVRAGVVALTKTDLVEDEWLELVRDDVAAQLAGTPFAAAPLVPVSARTGAGIDALRQALRSAIASASERVDDDLFRMPVDRGFTVHGTGTVTTGTVWSGAVERDESLVVLPAGAAARVRALQVHGAAVDRVSAGQRAAIALAGLDRDQAGRGAVLVQDAAWTAASMLTVRLRVLPAADWEIRHRQRLRVHLATAEVMARVVLFDADRLLPGDVGWAQLRLEAPLVARAGDRFVVRSYSPVTTIGGGVVAEPDAPKRKRLEDVPRELLERVLEGDPEEALAALARLRGLRGVPVAALPVLTPWPPARVERALDGLVEAGAVVAGGRLFAAATVERAGATLLDAVARHHETQPLDPTLSRQALRAVLPERAAPELTEHVLHALLGDGRLEAAGEGVRRPGFRPRLTDAQREASDALRRLLREGGLAPPTLPELPERLRARPDFDRLLALLEMEGAVVRVAEELVVDHDVLTTAIAELRRRFAGHDGLGPQELRQVLDVSRKYLIPLLQYLDAVGVTERKGDARRVVGGE